jgi:vancomycin resistance protein YoaR
MSYFLRSMRTLFIPLTAVLLLQVGCATSNSGSNTGKQEDPRAVSEDVQEDLRPRLKEAFNRMRTALDEGDLKTLQEIWVSPQGETYDMKTLSTFYSSKGKQVADAIRGARIIESLGADVSVPSTPMTERHPEAEYAGTLPVRNSYGDPRPLNAIYSNGSWRFIYRITIASASEDNDRAESSN